MNTNNKFTIENINHMSYTDFIGLINQWNVLPGSYTTLTKWINFSWITNKSHILEIACTTGFSSREIAELTGCTGEAFDLSEKSIEAALYNKNFYSPNIDLKYKAISGYDFTTNDKFTHVIAGASLGFFDEPQKMIDKCIEMLCDGGYILASPFYVTKDIPDELIKMAQSVFGITPTIVSYKEVMKLYRNLEIVYEDRNKLIQETEEELTYYCKCTIDRAVKNLNIDDNEIYSAMFDRLYSVKKMSNELRPYQMYNVLVLRYRKNIYPNRFVELF